MKDREDPVHRVSPNDNDCAAIYFPRSIKFYAATDEAFGRFTLPHFHQVIDGSAKTETAMAGRSAPGHCSFRSLYRYCCGCGGVAGFFANGSGGAVPEL